MLNTQHAQILSPPTFLSGFFSRVEEHEEQQNYYHVSFLQMTTVLHRFHQIPLVKAWEMHSRASSNHQENSKGKCLAEPPDAWAEEHSIFTVCQRVPCCFPHFFLHILIPRIESGSSDRSVTTHKHKLSRSQGAHSPGAQRGHSAATTSLRPDSEELKSYKKS